MIYKRIMELCAKKNLSVRFVEQEAGLSNGCISKWEKSDPAVSSLKKVANVLDVTIDQLVSPEHKTG